MWHARLAQHYRHSTGVVAFGRFVQGCSSRSEAHAAGQDLTTLLGLKYMHVCIRCAPSCEVRFAPGPMWRACDRPEAAASTGSGSRTSPASRLCSSSARGLDVQSVAQVGSSYRAQVPFRRPATVASSYARHGAPCPLGSTLPRLRGRSECQLDYRHIP